MPRTLKVGVAGLGPVGQAVARLVLQSPGLKLVSVVDPAPRYAGQDVGPLIGQPRKIGVRVEGEPERWLRRLKLDVAFVCTSSLLKEARPLISGVVARRVHVLTSCGELAFPTPGHAKAFRELDRQARAKKVAVLATGVNPGFAMDVLALTLTGPCARVRRVAVTRVVDAGGKLALQRRVGAGLNLGQFRRALTEGTIRHVGLQQSAQIIAAALGWKLERIDETVDPAIAPRDLDTEYLRIPAGAVAGLKQGLRAYRGSELAVSLDLQVYVGAESPRDHVLVDGDPPVDTTITGGLSSDLSTAALLVNSLPRALQAGPGLLTVKDLPLVHSLNPQELAASPRRGR